MADSSCIAELKETIEKMNVELSQSRTKISELDAKVREQEEKNTRLTRDLKECQEKCRATQKRLEFAEQKLAQFSLKPQTAAQIRQNLINDGSSSCSDGSDSDEDRRNPISDSSSSCSDGTDSDESPTHVRHPQIPFPPIVKYENSGVGKSVTNITHLFKRKKFDEGTKENNVKTSKLTSILKGDSKIRRNPINDGSSSCSDGSSSCSDGSHSDDDRRNPISDSSSSFSDEPDSEDSPTHISFPLVEKDGNSGVVIYGSNIKHVLKRKKPDEETKENVKTIKLTSILKDGSKVVENASKLYPVEDKIMDSYLLPTCYSNTNIKVILCHYIKDKEIEVDLVYVDYSSDFTICEQREEHHKSFIKKIEQDLNLNPFQEFEKFYVFGDREIKFINASFIVWLSQQKNNVKILLVPIFGCIYLLDFYEIMENTLKNKNINIELKEDDCYAIRSEYGIDMPKFVEVVRLKIDNIDSYVSEKIPQIIKSSNNYSIIHRNILLGQCSESCKVEDGKDGCEVEQLCEDEDLPFWLRF